MASTSWLGELALLASETSYINDIWNFDLSLDVEEQPRPLLHQKRVKGLRYDSIKPPKGIGFVRMFKGFRYPIGRKNL